MSLGQLYARNTVRGRMENGGKHISIVKANKSVFAQGGTERTK
jgi:hypothetical protein